MDIPNWLCGIYQSCVDGQLSVLFQAELIALLMASVLAAFLFVRGDPSATISGDIAWGAFASIIVFFMGLIAFAIVQWIFRLIVSEPILLYLIIPTLFGALAGVAARLYRRN